MLQSALYVALATLTLSCAQQIGKKPENHPGLTTQKCTKDGGCVIQKTSVVIDSLTHPIKDIDTGKPCVTSSGELNKNVCSTAEECGQKCALQGVNYAAHGVETTDDSMTLLMYQKKAYGNVKKLSPRVYLLDESGENYSMLQLLGQEVSFDVDMSNLPCGMNGALYLSEMDSTGNRGDLNPAGAAYGTGYCDAQCFNTSAFINGVANVNTEGACCNEMDLWEANSRATQYTPHTCNITSFYACTGAECGEDGVCDKIGCSYNPYALGDQDFYGLGKDVDSTKPMTVVTRFPMTDGTTAGTLRGIRRLYIQDGEIIHNAEVKFQQKTIDSVGPYLCKNTADDFQRLGGLPEMGEALGRGMVLAFSIWNDDEGYMNWLDAGDAGPCNDKEGNPKVIVKNNPGTSVTFSNIKWGDIGSTNDCTYTNCKPEEPATEEPTYDEPTYDKPTYDEPAPEEPATEGATRYGT